MEKIEITIQPEELVCMEKLLKRTIDVAYKNTRIRIYLHYSESPLTPDRPYNFKYIELPDECVEKDQGLVEDNFINAMTDHLFHHSTYDDDERGEVAEAVWKRIKTVLDEMKIILPW
jgi:hypothetical protein